LLDSDKTLQEKTAETLQIASKWEKNPPISEPKPLCVTDYSPAVAEQPQLPSEPCLPAEVILLIVGIANLCTVFDTFVVCSYSDFFDKILVQYVNIRKLIYLRLLYIILSTAEKYEIALP